MRRAINLLILIYCFEVDMYSKAITLTTLSHQIESE